MPLTDPSNEMAVFPYPATPETPLPEPGSSTGEVVGNTLLLGNPIAGFIGNRAPEATFQKEPNHNPFADGNLTGYEEHASRFIDSLSKEQDQYIKTRIDEERKMREVVASAGTTQSIAAFAVQMGADPFTYIGLGPVLTGLTKAAQAAKLGRAAAPAALGTTFGGITAANEALLQQQQETRTLEESGENISFAVAAGVAFGAFGEGLKYYNARQRAAILRGPTKEPWEVAAEVRAAAEPGSVGAAAAGFTAEEQAIKGAFGAEKVFYFNDPILRTMSSESTATRNLSEQIGESYLMRNKNTEGIASVPSIENEIKGYDTNLADFETAAKTNYMEYKKNGGTLNRDDFYEEIGKAAGQNDMSATPEIAKAAKALRENVFDPLWNQAVDLGLADPNASVKTAPSYVTRLFDKAKILADIPGFIQKNVEWLTAERASSAGRIAEWDSMIKTTNDAHEAVVRELRNDTSELKAGVSAERQALAKANGYRKGVGAYSRYLNNKVTAWRNRADKFEPDKFDSLEEDKYFTKLHKDVSRKPRVYKPEGLSEFIKKTGGVYDDVGYLETSDGIKGAGLLAEQGGRSIADAAKAAQEAGYFDQLPDDQSFIDSLFSDLGGSKIFRNADAHKIAYEEYVQSIRDSLKASGVEKVDAVGLREYIAQGLDGLDLYRASTPATRAKFAEIQYTLRRFEQQAEKIGEKLAQAERAAIEAAEKVDIRRAYLSEVRAGFRDLNKTRKGLAGKMAELQKSRDKDLFFADRDNDEIEFRAAEIMNRVLATGDTRLAYGFEVAGDRGGSQNLASKKGFSGPLRARVYDIPDSYIEPYLNRDAGAIAKAYVRALAPDVTMFQKFGTLDEDAILQPVADDYVRKILNATSVKESAKLKKARDADIRDLRAMLQRLRGTYGVPTDDYARGIQSAERVAAQFSGITALGGQVLASIVDVARPIMVNGMINTFRYGLKPLIANFKNFKLAADEVKQMGTGLDMVLHTRYNAMSGIDEFTPTATRIERAVNRESQRFQVLNLANAWNAGAKQFTGIIAQSRFIETAGRWARGEAVSQGDIERLSSSFVDKSMAKRITKQFEKYGEKTTGVYNPNIRRWDDFEAQSIFRAAMRREVDGQIITPGLNKPLWLTRSGIRLVGQFKSFSAASMQNIVIAGFQQRDAAVLNGVMVSVGFGMLSYAIKGAAAGTPLSDDPAVWVREGIDRSGITAWLFDVNNLVEKLSNNSVGLSALMGGQPGGRYASRSAMQALLGPAYGTLYNLVESTGAGLSDQWTARDTQNLRRMIPYQNLFYIRFLFDEMERGFNDAIGVEQRKGLK